MKKLNPDVEKSSLHQMSKDDEDPIVVEKQMAFRQGKAHTEMAKQEITLSGEMLFHMKKLEEVATKAALPAPTPATKLDLISK